MRRPDEQTSHNIQSRSHEQRVRADHPLQAIRVMYDRVFAELSTRFTKMYSHIGRPSIPPEQFCVPSCCSRRRFPTSLVPVSFIMTESSCSHDHAGRW